MAMKPSSTPPIADALVHFQCAYTSLALLSQRGVLLRATETGAAVEVSAEKVQGFSGGRCLTAKQSDLEVRFILAKAGGADRSTEPAGVLHAGAVVRTLGPGTVGIAAYDAAGRLLTQALNTGMAAAVPGPPMLRDEFLGVRLRSFEKSICTRPNFIP